MKTIYRSIILISAASTIALSGYAQKTEAKKDTTLNRQVLLERDFNPTLQDASKINTVPAMHQPEVKKANVQFEAQQTDYKFGAYPLGDTGPGNIKTAIDYSQKRGYLNLAGGTLGNLNGALGYKIVDTSSDQLDVFARYTSFDGNIKYSEKIESESDKVKAKYSNAFVGAHYQHSFEYLKWYLNANFENTGFNYYGNSFGNGWIGGAHSYNISKKQDVNNFGFQTGVISSESNEFIYNGSIAFNHFSTKYGPNVEDKGIAGNIIEAKLNIAAPFNESNNLVGIRLGIFNQNYTDVKFITDKEIKKDLFHNLTKANFAPYISFKNDDYSISLGANVAYAIDKKNKLVIAPEVDVKWQFAENTSFYLNTTGGINDNSFLYILQENRYANPSAKIEYSRTLIDGLLGIKSAITKGLELDVFAGYNQTNNDHLYVVGDTYSWGNVGTPQYVDLGTGKFGAILKTNLIPRTNLSAKAIGYFYNVSFDQPDGGSIPEKAWNLPSFVISLNADINPIDNFNLSLNYNLQTGRKGYGVSLDETKMKNINELNIRGDYRLTDWLSVNAQLYNVLNQKYDTYYGYTQQGFAVMGGVSFKF